MLGYSSTLSFESEKEKKVEVEERRMNEVEGKRQRLIFHFIFFDSSRLSRSLDLLVRFSSNETEVTSRKGDDGLLYPKIFTRREPRVIVQHLTKGTTEEKQHPAENIEKRKRSEKNVVSKLKERAFRKQKKEKHLQSKIQKKAKLSKRRNPSEDWEQEIEKEREREED